MFGLKLVLIALVGTLIASVPLTLEPRHVATAKGDLLPVKEAGKKYGLAKVWHVEGEHITYAALQPLPGA